MPRPSFPAFIRSIILAVRVPLVGVLDTAGAVTFLASVPIGFQWYAEKLIFLPDITGVGAGATQGLQLRKGGAAGTVLATTTPTLANHVLGGASIQGSVAAADSETAFFNDTDLLSITKAAGTLFTTAGGTLLVVGRQRPQARQ